MILYYTGAQVAVPTILAPGPRRPRGLDPKTDQPPILLLSVPLARPYDAGRI